MKTAKQEYLDNEADAWFKRNLAMIEKRGPSIGTKFFADFYNRYRENNVKAHYRLGGEIGSCFGYNLAWLSEKFTDIHYHGIEPSEAAVTYGSEKYAELIKDGRINLIRGTADELPFADESLDFILIGFCLYQADRKLLGKIVSEIDRCLTHGGFLVITDFDVLSGIKKNNIHNTLTPTYKLNYAKFFEGTFGYTLVEKTTYNADAVDARCFPIRMEDRVSTQILYKEHENDIYIIR